MIKAAAEVLVGDDQPLPEVTRRYLLWARTRVAQDGSVSRERTRAWNAYVDARDGLKDGTTEEREALKAGLNQMGLFDSQRRFQ